MDPIISVLIPTHKRTDLLERLLTSLASAVIPSSIDKIHIVENGSEVCEPVVNKYKELPLQYHQFAIGNKSLALNEVLSNIPEEHFILFFDDDIRVAPQIFEKLDNAIRQMGSGYYYGGPVGIDYEVDPMPELFPFMPMSSKGTSQAMTKPGPSAINLFLGCNWGCFLKDLNKMGSFDSNLGPGAKSGSRGQENDAQRRLFDQGLKPIYVPDALVYHWVPKENLTKEWILDRCYKAAMFAGGNTASPWKPIIWKLKIGISQMMKTLSIDRLKNEARIMTYKGCLAGYALKK